MTRRPMATPRGSQWRVEPRHRWRGWAQALCLLLVLVATGVDRVSW